MVYYMYSKGKDEMIVMETFSVIQGRFDSSVLFLGFSDKENKIKWFRDSNEAIYFQNSISARKFATNYFKNFNGYEVVEIIKNIK